MNFEVKEIDVEIEWEMIALVSVVYFKLLFIYFFGVLVLQFLYP